jgi:hypothetical protein
LAKLDSLIDQNSSKDGHGDRYNGGNKASAVSSVSISTTEAISLQVFNTLGNSFRIRHVGSSSGENIGTFFTGPVTWGEDGSLLAQTKSGADITLEDEVVVDAAGHVSEISINCGHASINIFHLWADNGFQDFSLFSKTGLREEVVNKEKS